jgi:AraC-like DNA-binding protein
MEIIIWIGLSQSLFEGILITTKKQQNVSDKILSAWLFLLGFSFLLIGINNEVLSQPLLTNPFLLFNPAFYLYIKSLTDRSFKIRWIQLLHLFPFLIFQIIILNKRVQLAYSSINFGEDKFAFTLAFISVTILSWLIYNTISLIIVHRHRKSLKNEFSTIEDNERIGWLLFITIFYVIFCFFLLTLGIYLYLTGSDLYLTQEIAYAVFLFLVYVLGYYGLKQKLIFRELPPAASIKYEKSVLMPGKKSEIKKKIIGLFQNDLPYLNPDFCLDLLAEQTGFPNHQITEVLNTEIKQNFFHLVNSYRVEEVKKHLKNKKNHYSIEAIGYECGFNSKSSYYTIFKKNTGKTPTEYRNSLL